MAAHPDFLSLWEYFRDVFVPFNRLELPLKPLHRGVCDTLQRAFLGDLHKSFVAVNIPPRVGKTKICEAYVSWILAYFPEAQNLYLSYSNELAKTSVRYIQETMGSAWYMELFPTRLGKIRQADHFTTEQGGKVYGDGVGGSLTGLGAGLKRKAGGVIILDDPSKPDDALSRVESAKLRFWFENTLKSRRNSSQWTPIVVCMQRLDTEDLTGFLLANYPADVELVKFSGFVNGESTIPETTDTQSMLDTQRVNPFAFAAQIMQEPQVLGGNLIKLDDFRYYDPASPPKWEYKAITCDTATKTREANDYSVAQCWGRSLRRAFLIDQIRGKWSAAELIRNVAVFHRKHHVAASPVGTVLIEEASAGEMLIQELRKKGIPARGIIRLTDKVSRVQAILPYQATGMVYLPRGAPWLPAFELECASFRADGKSAHDDQCVLQGTPVDTRRGVVPIEEVRPADQVMTRQGWRSVRHAAPTGSTEDPWLVVSTAGHVLAGTGNHPVWTEEQGFSRIDSLPDGVTLKAWHTQKKSFSTVSLFAAIPIARTSRIGTTTDLRPTTSAQGSSISIRKSGKRPTGGRSLKAMSSTMRTATPSTTPRTTSASSHGESTPPSTGRVGTFDQTARNNWISSLVSVLWRQHGTRPPPASGGTDSTLSRASLATRPTRSLAKSAGRSSTPSALGPSFVPIFAGVGRGGKIPRSMSGANAITVAESFGFSAASYRVLIGNLKSFVLACASGSSARVYNLEVEGSPEYVAGGLLVHNCDCMVDAVGVILGKGTSILSVLGSERKKTAERLAASVSQAARPKTVTSAAEMV